MWEYNILRAVWGTGSPEYLYSVFLRPLDFALQMSKSYKCQASSKKFCTILQRPAPYKETVIVKYSFNPSKLSKLQAYQALQEPPFPKLNPPVRMRLCSH